MKVTAGKTTPLEKARAIYEYVFDNMKYDKTGTGWGRGDVLYACDAKKGNCTDFHSLFISMARSQGIPARFEIGFPLPPTNPAAKLPATTAGLISSSRCTDGFRWTFPRRGSIRKKKDYFFGAHDDNRVQFSVGRDLVLNPKQDGEPLNYFVYPYVEVGGKEYPNVSNAFSFTDVDSGATASFAGAQR